MSIKKLFSRRCKSVNNLLAFEIPAKNVHETHSLNIWLSPRKEKKHNFIS